MKNLTDRSHRRTHELYWRRNLQVLAVLLTVWAAVSFGCGILFADRLDAFSIGGFPLGFWFAQQGSIVVFVALIFIYAAIMNRLDRIFDVADRHEEPKRPRRGDVS